ncbi:MAG: PKD domain-containing protein, partial [Bacteroidia bacterium]|nr:PKD domain-containing protein [Bacteroidia bacterium]
YLSNPINASSGLTVLAFGPSVSGANGVIYNPSSPPHPNSFPTCWIYNENDANVVENKHPQWGWVSATTAANQLQTMRGYAVIISGAQTLSFTGVPNSGGLNIPITYTVSGSATYDGSNLVGNPYPSPISWNAILALGGNAGQISSVVKRFSSTTTYTGQYADWNGSVGTNGANDNIALGQGFFVQALSGANNFVMTNNVRRSTPGAGFFEEAPATPANGILRLKVSGGKGADEAVLYIDNRASDAFDRILDAPKMLGTLEGLPNLYTLAGEENVSINALSELKLDKTIPLDVVVTQAGTHLLEVLELKNFDPSSIVLLEDRQKGVFYNLRNVANLSYDLQPGTISGRFFIHLKPGITFEATAETCKKLDGKITLTNPSNSPRKLIVSDVSGQVRFEKAAFTGTIVVNGLETGNYNVQLTGAEGSVYTLQVEIPDAIAANPDFNASSTEIEAGQEIQFNANSLAPLVQYNWFVGPTQLSSLPSFSYTFSEPGIYPVELKVTRGLCSESSVQNIFVNPTGGTGNFKASYHIKVYPNPSSEYLGVELGSGYKDALKEVEITDAAGRQVYKGNAEGVSATGKLNLAVHHLANGAYNLSLLFNTGIKKNRSFMVAH